MPKCTSEAAGRVGPGQGKARQGQGQGRGGQAFVINCEGPTRPPSVLWAAYVVPLYGSYLESYKVIPKRNC